MQYGRFGDARLLLEAAGARNELLALCVFQGDFIGLQAYGRQAGRDVQRLADQLVAVNEDAFRRVGGGGGLGGAAGSRALYGGRPNTEDWVLSPAGPAAATGTLSVDEGSVGEEEAAEAAAAGGLGAGEEDEDVEVAPAGRLPFMEACLQVTSTSTATPQPTAAGSGEADGQPIPSLDLGTLEAYVGIAGATVAKLAVGTPTAAGAAAAGPAAALGGGISRLNTGLSDMSAAQEEAAAAKGWDSDNEEGSAGGPAPAAAAPTREGETTAQAAARAAFRKDTQGLLAAGGGLLGVTADVWDIHLLPVGWLLLLTLVWLSHLCT